MTQQPPHMPSVRLDETNMSSLGFARFAYPDEPALDNGDWQREIEIARLGGERRMMQSILAPDSLIIPLSRERERRLSRATRFTVRQSSGMLDPLRLLSHRAGWNQTQQDLAALSTMDPEGAFLASYATPEGNIPLGAGLVLPVAEGLAWIGMILVHREVRRQGIAQAVVDRCVEYALTERGYTINGLDATPDGSQVYRALGYRESFRLWRSTLDTTAGEPDPATPAVTSLETVDPCVEYETRCGMVNRQPLLAGLFGGYPQGCFLHGAGSTVNGYLFSRPGRLYPFVGPFIADNPDIAADLLAAARAHWRAVGEATVVLDTPAQHFHGGHQQDRQDYQHGRRRRDGRADQFANAAPHAPGHGVLLGRGEEQHHHQLVP